MPVAHLPHLAHLAHLPTVRRAVVVLVLALSCAALVGPADATRTAPGEPRIPAPTAIAAPIGKPGGVLSSAVSCAGNVVEPRVRWKLTRVANGKVRLFRWRGAYPNARFPRVPPGEYRSRTAAWCGENKLVRKDRLTVTRKTRQATVSRAEFAAIEVGMTRAEVSAVVGFEPSGCFTSDGEATCSYDMMRFWSWALVFFDDDGVVTDKLWNAGHD